MGDSGDDPPQVSQAPALVHTWSFDPECLGGVYGLGGCQSRGKELEYPQPHPTQELGEVRVDPGPQGHGL